MVRKYLQKNRDKITYLFFGGCTTVVNLIVFRLLLAAGAAVTAANAVAIICAILFAYVTNTLWVFHGRLGWRTLWRFAAARVVSAAVELVGVWLLNLVLPAMVAKLVTQVAVIVMNYLLSKKIVFAKENGVKREKKEKKNL